MASRPVAARPEELRRHNLSRLLSEIHQHGERSRAELTTALGLNRSTIGALVAGLVDLDLVTERRPSGGDRAGRPSHVVAPRSDLAYVLAVDLAVEHMTMAVVGLGGVVQGRVEYSIGRKDRHPEAIAERIAKEGAQLVRSLPGARPRAVGVSIPGAVRQRDGFVEQAPNLKWSGIPFATILEARLPWPVSVHIGNDADLGAIAEHQRGSAIGYDHLIYLNGSVGVGAGIISDGRPLHGSRGYAGEIGHVTINPDGPPCHCGSTGCIETYLGVHAFLREAGVSDVHGAEAESKMFAAAAAGEPEAAEAVHSAAIWLGRTLANLVNLFNPQAIVVGGSLAEVMRLESATVDSVLTQRAMAAARAAVTVLLPGLAEDPALIGAAELAFADLLSAPERVSIPT